MKATMSILGLHNATDGAIWDDLVVPTGINGDVLVMSILAECAELEVLYPEPATMGTVIGLWSAAELPVWRKLYETTQFDYNPIGNKDGTVTLTSSYSGGGKRTSFKYNVKPEIAQKMRDYVTAKNLARLSKEEIKTPVMFDNFTSASFSMSFDDSSIGGSPYEHCYVNCGPAGMTFRTIKNELSEILKECRETGECILNEETQTGSGFPGMGGMMGMGNFPVMMPRPPKEAWTCPSCGQEGITSRFCPQCAAPAPGAPQAASAPAPAPDVTVHPTIFAMDPPPAPGETWTCACGQEGNTGKFCPSCGNPSPAYLAQFEIKPDQS